MSDSNPTIGRIGVFYDGAYFLAGAEYFCDFQGWEWCDLRAFHSFIELVVGKDKSIPNSQSRIVFSAWFEGRYTAPPREETIRVTADHFLTITRGGYLPEVEEATRARGLSESAISDCGIELHLLPTPLASPSYEDKRHNLHQKGAIVALALTALEMGISKKIDVLVLVTGDGDLVPLLQKLYPIDIRTYVVYFATPPYQKKGGVKVPFLSIDRELKEAVEFAVRFDDEAARKVFGSGTAALDLLDTESASGMMLATTRGGSYMEQAKVFCPNCGTPSLSGTRFCSKCGTKLPDLSGVLSSLGEEKSRPGERAGSAEPLGPDVSGKEEGQVTPATERVTVGFVGGPPSVFLKQEVTPESEVDPRFVQSYSFGPGCGFYLLNRVFWPLFLIGAVLNLMSRGLESMAQTPTDLEVTLAPLPLVFGVLALAYLGVLLWLGSVARKKRWERLNWKSFAQFRSDEGAWNIAGIIGWILTAIVFVVSLASGCS